MQMETAEFFDSLLRYVPSDVYFPVDHGDEVPMSKYLKNRKGANRKQILKEASKKGKRAKYESASNPKTIVEIQQQQAEPEKDGFAVAKAKNTLSEDAPSTLDGLRDRLHQKIRGLRGNRPEAPSSKKRKRNVPRGNKIPTEPKPSKKRRVEPTPAPEIVEKAAPAPELEELQFSAFTFESDSKATKAAPKQRNLERMLQQATAHQKRLVELKQKGDDSALLQHKWKMASKKAAGDSLLTDAKLTDPKLLKKRVKDKKKKKEKSRKEWAERTKQATVEKEAKAQLSQQKKEKTKKRSRRAKVIQSIEEKAKADAHQEE